MKSDHEANELKKISSSRICVYKIIGELSITSTMNDCLSGLITVQVRRGLKRALECTLDFKIATSLFSAQFCLNFHWF